MTTNQLHLINLWSEPNYNSGWQVLAKWAIWLWVGLVIAFLLFIILMTFGWLFDGALENNIQSAGMSTVNPLMPFIFVIIAFIATFVGNTALAWTYNLFYSTKYYDLGKMFSISMLSNVLIFFVFIPLYLLNSSSIVSLFAVLGFHIIFAIFTSYTHIEILTNPNYSSSHLIGSTIGIAVSSVLVLIIQAALKDTNGNPSRFILLFPPIIWYVFIPFIHALWEKIYYRFYENGNDFLYLPTLQEMTQQEASMSETVTDNDITVDIQ